MSKTMLAPTSVPTREAGPIDAHELAQKTVRVPILCPPVTALAAVLTPAPHSGRQLSRGSVARTGEEEYGVGLRAGDSFLGFKLVEELGQGAFARVFLAHQESLSGRLVALKVTLRTTREAERLARLQHTNVVPVYSVHSAPPVQVICMPYLGRRTVADEIRSYRDEHPSRDQSNRRTSGTRAARTTGVVDGAPTLAAKADSGVMPRAAIVGGEHAGLVGDPVAVLRILSQLAAGLAHAHERGILHLDLKPANVLLPDTGEPMLLDFNLSFDLRTADRELVGGTIPYMAIEQLLDLRSRGNGNIDERTDLYSLGVMAFEMLTGSVPFPAASKDLLDMDGLIAVRRQTLPSLCELNPAVTPAIEAIVHKLLAPEPVDRYQSANELKTDIDRHLADRPLLFATEPSLAERAGKWRRRNPGIVGRLVAATLFGLVIALGALAYRNHEAQATTDAAARLQSTRASLDTVRLDLILPGDDHARRRGIARAEELLEAYGLPGDLEWQSRPQVRRLPDGERAALTRELGELMALLAQAKWADAEPKGGKELETGAQSALKLNRAARACYPADGVPAMLARQAATVAFAAGAEAEASTSTGMPDPLLDAAAAIRQGKYKAALSALEKLVAERPDYPTAQLCLAFCKEQLGRHDAALERYDMAEALLPGDPRPAYRRGVIHGMQARHEDAIREFSRAIELDPDCSLAHRNRGFAHFRLGELRQRDGQSDDAKVLFEKAEADLSRALELGGSRIQILTYRYQVRRLLGDNSGAAADQHAAEALTPGNEADYISRSVARLKASQYRLALDDLSVAIRLNPRSITALNNQVYILADKLGEPESALGVATRITEICPEYGAGRIMRAVLLARLGKRADAHAETETALKLCKDATVAYRAACVFALTSAIEPNDEARALALLERAVKCGYNRLSEIKNDRDLDNIRDTKRYREIVDALSSLYQ